MVSFSPSSRTATAAPPSSRTVTATAAPPSARMATATAASSSLKGVVQGDLVQQRQPFTPSLQLQRHSCPHRIHFLPVEKSSVRSIQPVRATAVDVRPIVPRFGRIGRLVLRIATAPLAFFKVKSCELTALINYNST
ncbi:hypothetical protein EUGRSUZ_E03076 [Eucalyptus grandis]|uniref:Uncharacterized protein n=2 Tax=Eucalyptus grandis TaxID=71139 RepID=A0ACC3KYG2_EUCGR|nr:hypothetical protein EUGRSUZ_E03076 [Eucalyptus grandis]